MSQPASGSLPPPRTNGSRRVSLVGFMASGKSTIGPRLAARLGVPFVDLDAAISSAAGRSVNQIFEERGEQAFRDLESSTLTAQLAAPELVVATGGGVVERPVNRERLREHTLILWLDIKFETARQRLSGSAGRQRPLVQTSSWDDLARLYLRRRAIYAELAHFRFECDRDLPARLVRRMESSVRAFEESTV